MDLKLDYSLSSPEERRELVDKIVSRGDGLTEQQLGHLADYMLFATDSQQTKRERDEERPIVTRNRETTILKRQTSLDDLVASLPNGEDGLYQMMESDKTMPLDRREPITEADVCGNPVMAEKQRVLDSLRQQMETAPKSKRYSLQRQIISTYKEMYTIKKSRMSAAHARPDFGNGVRPERMSLDDKIVLGADGLPHGTGAVSLTRPEDVATILQMHTDLVGAAETDLDSDVKWLFEDLKRAIAKTFPNGNERLYYLTLLEMMNTPGNEIVELMRQRYGESHTEQYYSTLWRRRIPKMIAETVQKEWLIWHYTFEDPDNAVWKVCNTCGKRMLAHPLFFHKNTSKDGYYSKCRRCRSRQSGGDA